MLARRRVCGRKLLESESDTGDRYQIARRKKSSRGKEDEESRKVLHLKASSVPNHRLLIEITTLSMINPNNNNTSKSRIFKKKNGQINSNGFIKCKVKQKEESIQIDLEKN